MGWVLPDWLGGLRSAIDQDRYSLSSPVTQPAGLPALSASPSTPLNVVREWVLCFVQIWDSPQKDRWMLASSPVPSGTCLFHLRYCYKTMNSRCSFHSLETSLSASNLGCPQQPIAPVLLNHRGRSVSPSLPSLRLLPTELGVHGVLGPEPPFL